MAKQLSLKQQLINQLAQQTVAQLNQAQTQQNDLSQLQAEYDAWNNQQQIASLQNEYDAWVQAQQQPAQPAQIPTIANTQPKRDLQAEAKEYFAKARRERREQEAEAKRIAEQKYKENAENYARQQQEENMLASMSARKEEKVGKRPEAIDFSAPIAAKLNDKTLPEKKSAQKKMVDNPFMDNYMAIKTLNDLDPAEAKQLAKEAAREQAVYNTATNETLNRLGVMTQRDLEKHEDKGTVGEGINQLDLSKYNLPETERDEAAIKQLQDLETAKAWTDPNHKLTKEEQAEAKRIAREGIERLERRDTDSPAYIGRKRSEMTPEEQAQYDTYKALETKSNGLKSFAIGAADKALDYGKAILQGVANTQSRQLSAENEAKQALGLDTGLTTEELTQFEPETRQNIKQLNEDTAYARSLGTGAAPLATVNLPVLGQTDITPYGLGQTATQLAAYSITNPAFDMLGTALGAGSGIGGKIAGFVGNQVGQNVQDFVLDTSLVMDQVMNDPTLTDQQRADAILESIEMNAIGNLAAYGLLKALPEGVAMLVKKGLDNKVTTEATEDVVANAAKQYADAAAEIERLSQQIPAVDEDITASTNRQFSDLMNTFNSQFKDESAMKNIFTPEDLEASQNAQFKSLMDENLIPERLNPQVEMEMPEDVLGAEELKALQDELPTWKTEEVPAVKNVEDIAPKKTGYTQSDYQEILDKYRAGERLTQYEDEVLQSAILEEKYDNLRRYSDDIVNVEKSNIPDDVLKHIMGSNYDNQLDSVKLSGELAKRGFNIWENGFNNNIMKNYGELLDAVAHHSKGENIPAEIMAEAYDITHKNGGSLFDAIELAAKMNSPKKLLSDDLSDQIFYYYDDLFKTYGNSNPKLENKNFSIPTADINTFEKDGKTLYQVVDTRDQRVIKEYKTLKAAEKAKEEFIAGDVPKQRAIDAYNDIGKRINDYEKALFKEADQSKVDAAKRAVEAARKRYERAMKDVNPTYYDDVSAKSFADKITAPYYTRYPKEAAKLTDEEIDAMVQDWLDYDKANEPNKWVRDAEPAEGFNGRYNVQTFADGEAPKEEWKTSKFKTNTDAKTGWVKDESADPVKDYAYRVYSEAEQNADAAAKNLSAEDLIYKDQFDPSDVKQAMKLREQLLASTDKESLRKANRLGRKIAFETREGARLPQALAEFTRNTPEGQLRYTQQAIDDIVDKKAGVGTSESLDNLVEEIQKAYDKFGDDKEGFSKKVSSLLDENLRSYANGKTKEKMAPKAIKGKNKILKMIANGADIDDIADVVYKQNGGVKLTGEENAQIFKLLKQAKDLPEGSYEQEELLSRAAKIAVGRAPSTLGQKVRSVLYTNMLGNFKTAFSRNAMGNAVYQGLEQGRQPIAAAVDKLVSLKTGKHSALGWNKGKAKSYLQGFKKGTLEQISDMIKHIDTGRSGAKGWEMALANNASTFDDSKAIGKFCNDVEYYVRNAMELGDRPFYEANYQQAYTEMLQLIDRYGKDGVAGLEGIEEENLPQVIDMIASVRAADSVFQKHGKVSKGLTDIRNGLGELSEGVLGVDVLSTAASPFTMTPGNMLQRAIEYTPLGAVKNGFETAREVLGHKGFNQRRFVDEASRTIAGIPILMGTTALAKNGTINGGFSTDQDEKQAQIDDGYIEYGFNVPDFVPYYGDKTLDTSDWPVLGPMMQAGAAYAEKGWKDPSASLQAAEAVLGGAATQGLRKAFGADSSSWSGTDTFVNNLINTVGSSATQLVPSLVRQTAQTSDKYKRDLGEYGTKEYYFNNVLNSIPGVRQTLPIKTNVEGEPVLQNQGRGIGAKILENYVLPMNVSEYKQSPLNQEASRLLESAETAMAFVPKAKRTDLRNWDEKAEKEYSEEQFRNYKKEFGTLNSEAGHALIDSSFYQGLDDKEKAKVLSDTYSAMKQIAREKATGIPTDDKIATAYKEGGTEGMINHIAGKTAAKETGLSSSSKASKAIQEAADNGDVEAALTMSEQSKLLPNYGLDMPGPAGAYTKAYSVYDGITAEDFAKTYKAVDVDHNQSLAKKEVVNYMNSHNMNYADGMKFWKAYAKTEGSSPWKIPSLKDGVWK